MLHGSFMKHIYFPEELLYVICCKFGCVNHCCQKKVECQQL